MPFPTMSKNRSSHEGQVPHGCRCHWQGVESRTLQCIVLSCEENNEPLYRSLKDQGIQAPKIRGKREADILHISSFHLKMAA